MADASTYISQRIDEGAHLIPAHMVDAVRSYVLYGYPPGSFLSALLSNDFMGAAGRADSDNMNALRGWAQFLYNYMPAGSYGSPERYNAVVNAGGFLGMQEAA